MRDIHEIEANGRSFSYHYSACSARVDCELTQKIGGSAKESE